MYLRANIYDFTTLYYTLFNDFKNDLGYFNPFKVKNLPKQKKID